MKKIGLIFIVLAVIVILAIRFMGGGADYDKANEEAKSLKSYRETISTVVTIEDNGNVRQSAVDQIVDVANKGKKSMIYNVATTATSTDMATGEVKTEENSYMFYNNNYYYSYPGVRYKSPVAHDMALSNINNLTDVITFSSDEMINTYTEEADGDTVFYYQVNYENVSAFVKGVLENAIASFEGVNFSPVDMNASATVREGAVCARDLYVEYASQSGQKVTVEIYTELTGDVPEIEKPDESKYLNIAG